MEPPYLLFLGDVGDQLAAKTASGIVHWRPERCFGQLRLPGCCADLGIPDRSIEEARAAGVRTLVIGVANAGGILAESWIDSIREAIRAGMDVASGLHRKLADIPEIAELAAERGVTLHDVRHPTRKFATGIGRRRSGRRLLTVGTDCSCGKMYTALAIEREMRVRGMKATFRATGQTGILIAGDGVSVDAVVADFISGAVEWLTPANDADHWDIVEGQGSLFHPAFAGVSLGLLHGAQADALVLCHEPSRRHMRGLPHQPLPDIEECMDLNLRAARLTNPDVRFVGLSVNSSALAAAEREAMFEELRQITGLPVVDPFATGVGPLVDALS